MDHKTFAKLVDTRMKTCRAVLIAKAKEYASETFNDDRLCQFKEMADFNYEIPERSCWNLAGKHLFSIRNMLFLLQSGEEPTEEYVAEKLTDLHNYLYLLEGLLADRRGAA